MSGVVMAYSGGLETTACIHWLRNRKGFKVLTFSADLGQDESAEVLSLRALELGVDSVHIADLRERFVTDFTFPAIRASARTGSGSYLSVALSRAIITQEVVRVAQENGCRYIAHGGRGKSNDQGRFVLAAAALAPELEVIAPLRETPLLTRQAITEYAEKHQLPVDAAGRVTYNEDFNLWGSAISSAEIEDTWTDIPESLYRLTTAPSEAPDTPGEVAIDFERGLPVGLDGQAVPPVELVTKLNELAGSHGVGRCDCIEDFTVGIKTRMIYEAPAAAVLFRAHRALEELCLSAEMLRIQEMLSRQYSILVYRGDWFTPLREALDQFFVASQRKVTGRIRIRLFKGVCSVAARESRFSLYDRELATGGDDDSFDHSSAHGFLDITAISRKLEARQRQTE